uniref:Outer membrane porin, OprD family n=1 Tax=Thermodesulfobacterium geofontis TaxID=1295609 RepID=A0A7C4NWA8_9BACT
MGGYYTAGIDQTARIKYWDNSEKKYVYATTLSNFDKNEDKIISITPVHAIGGWVELGFNPIPKLQTWVGWGIDNPLNSDLKGVKGARLQQQMYYAHFLYKFVSEFGLGLEYLRAITDYRKEDGDDGVVNRFMLSFYYFF